MRGWFFKNYYRVLNIQPGASKKEIELAYRRALEMADGMEGFTGFIDEEEKERNRQILKEAYEVLSDEKARFFYDLYLIWKKEAFVRIEEKREEEIEEVTAERISGAFLKRIREKMGMSVKELSSKACITVRMVNAIENEDKELLPPYTYLKGILKEYARALSLPEKVVIEGYIKKIQR